MSLHKALRELAMALQNEDPGLENPGDHRDGLFDASDRIFELLDRFPVNTGHEWENMAVYMTDDPHEVAQIREICKLCGMDRVWGDEASVCDSRRPSDEKPEEVDDAS